MVVSKKDKDFILLIISAIFLLWFIFNITSYSFSVLSLKNSKNIDILLGETQKNQWLNVSRTINRKDIEGRIIIVDFCAERNIKCIKNISQIKKLKKKFGNKILVLNIAKIDAESDIDTIKNFIKKSGVDYPVIIDTDEKITELIGNSQNGTALLAPNGSFVGFWSDFTDFQEISIRIDNLIDKYGLIFNARSFPTTLDYADNSILNFPSKVEYAKNFKYKNRKINALIIANIARNNIVISSLDGKIIGKLGLKEQSGFVDGNLSEAQFNHPSGLLYSKNILYVADSLNHAIRKVDFKNKTVTTIIGSGIEGGIIKEKLDAKQVKLSYPNDLNYFPDKNHIIIANSGTNQLLKYDIINNKISPFVGNGDKGMKDGPKASLAWPISLDVFRNKLYFIDQESSSLRIADKTGYVRTLIGHGLAIKGNKNGKKEQALMNNPLGLFVNNNGIYIADGQNNLIRKYDLKSRKLTNYSGDGKKANNIGKNTSYNNVSDLVLIKNNFYIADSHNNRIVVKNKINGKTSILDIIPRLILEQNSLAEHLPDIKNLKESNVKSDVAIDLNLKLKEGYRINDLAPSLLNLIKINDKKEASLIASYDWNIIKNSKIKLPKLSGEFIYYLQGKIYYCQDKKDSLCLVSNYESKIIPASTNKNNIIEIIL